MNGKQSVGSHGWLLWLLVVSVMAWPRLSQAAPPFTTLRSFTYSDGANPAAGLIQGTDGGLYGTTYQGGAGGSGTVFKVNTDGTNFTLLHSFSGSDGARPRA